MVYLLGTEADRRFLHTPWPQSVPSCTREMFSRSIGYATNLTNELLFAVRPNTSSPNECLTRGALVEMRLEFRGDFACRKYGLHMPWSKACLIRRHIRSAELKDIGQ
jgi:hypothetical protein